LGILIAFGHAFLGMSGLETLAQVYREMEAPKLLNLKRAAAVIFFSALVLTGVVSFLAVGRAPRWKQGAARASGVLLLVFAAGVLLDAGRRWWFGTEPIGWTMIGLALVAALVNLWCLRILRRIRSDDANLHAAETFSLNDSVSNGGIIVAGLLVMWLGRAWPDVLVGVLVAVIAVKGGIEILRDAQKAGRDNSEER